MTRHCYFLLLALFLAALSAGAVPKDDDYMRLARLSYIDGNVSCQHTGDVDWSAASVNLPLEPGDRIYTGNDGRAEIEFDDGSILRLAHGTDIEILSLREDLIQIRSLVGLSTLIVTSDTDFEIDTPAAAFTVLEKGNYRFGVDENGDSDAVVRKGELEAANDSFSRRLLAGEMVRVSANDADKPEYARYDERDEWDEWNDRRNADMSASVDRRYLPDTVNMGVYDLNSSGRWVNVEDYGSAWVPYGISDSWAPYSMGRWCYRPFYGWTWVSYEPWGWLPYHYGRWYRSSIYGWCWLPGPSFAFNFWAPALVTFYSGPGWISWCPLGPGDYYNLNRYHYNHGIYGYQLVRLRALSTRVQGDLFHRGDRDAFRTVDIDQFRNGSFGGRDRGGRFRDVDQPWKQGEVVRDSLPVQPTQTSYRPDPDRHARGPERTAKQLPTVVRNNPGDEFRGVEKFRRISNPAIPALPSKTERRMTEQQRAPQQGTDSGTNTRARWAPRREPPNPGAKSQQENTPSDQGARKVPTYRYTGTLENNSENAKPGENTAPAARPDTTRTSEPRNAPGVLLERPAPEPKRAQPPSSVVSPRTEEPRQPNNSEQGSGAQQGNSRGSGPAETPRTGGYHVYRPPRSESAPPNPPPQTENTPPPSTPRAEHAPDNAAPRQTAPAAEKGDGSRNSSAPSQNKSSGNSGSSSSDKSGGKSSSDAPAGGDQHSRDRK
ncbi:MAG TPA: DUF6600 domain-containing protein [Acidobacteriota bacterium]|nr:DUF6600 domain-containing protein [Acidobacteriota bacterium]